MKPSIFQTLKLATAAAAVGFALAGCMTQAEREGYSPDGGNALIAQESSNMGTVLNTQPLAKAAVESGDTGEVIIKRISLTADSACLPGPCFVRSAQFTTSSGRFDRDRQDTIWLLDSNNAYMTVFRPFQATTIVHHRHVVKTKGDRSVDIQFNTTLTWGVDGAGNRVGVWNGTITGTINGETVNATISGVKRPFTPGAGCGAPREGSIHLERGGNVIDINFEEGGKARCEITDRKGRRHHEDIEGDRETARD